MVRFKENGASHEMKIEVGVVDLSLKASFLTEFNEPEKKMLDGVSTLIHLPDNCDSDIVYLVEDCRQKTWIKNQPCTSSVTLSDTSQLGKVTHCATVPLYCGSADIVNTDRRVKFSFRVEYTIMLGRGFT